MYDLLRIVIALLITFSVAESSRKFCGPRTIHWVDYTCPGDDTHRNVSSLDMINITTEEQRNLLAVKNKYLCTTYICADGLPPASLGFHCNGEGETCRGFDNFTNINENFYKYNRVRNTVLRTTIEDVQKWLDVQLKKP
ncbi:hypothetical protein [Heliothis virescens ascovirus 3h]|uniref:Uncharacterized protein n=1 Tax=Heliothis virescens ascovirus 3h TaxID=1268039 RepID=A0A386JAM0_9VIRU|nr:hypothetical protein [Heliothis virescens ascovirus 3h]